MTLEDAVDVRDYLTERLGNTAEVINFGNEFVHRFKHSGLSRPRAEKGKKKDKKKQKNSKKLMMDSSLLGFKAATREGAEIYSQSDEL